MLLDTQAAIWMAIGQHLGRQTQKLVNQAVSDDLLTMSAVSFWEMAMLIAKRRLRTRKSAGELRAAATGNAGDGLVEEAERTILQEALKHYGFFKKSLVQNF